VSEPSWSEDEPQSWGAATANKVVTALWFILAVWGWLWLGPVWLKAMRPDADRINDFYQDWGSARNYWVSLPIYTHHAISVPQHLGLSSNPVPSIEYNAHPPSSVLLVLPLGRLSYPNAVLVWNLISLVTLGASFKIVARELALPRALVLPTVALMAFCHPIYGNIYQGQLTLILVLLVTTIWALERSGKSYLAGLLLGVAAAIKLFPAYMVVYFAARGRFRPMLAAVGAFLTLTMLTALVLGWNTYSDYITVVMNNQAKFRSFAYNLSIAGFWHKLFDPVDETGPVEALWLSPALARWGTLLSDLAISILVVLVTRRAQTPAQRDLAFASTVAAMLLVSPVTWDFSLPLLLVSIAVVMDRIRSSHSRWVGIALTAILTIDWVPQTMLTELMQAGSRLSVFPWTFMLGAPSLKFYALMGTFAAGLACFRSEKCENLRTDRWAGLLTDSPDRSVTPVVGQAG
jgi:alpha-1,2-mannosyltransferase